MITLTATGTYLMHKVDHFRLSVSNTDVIRRHLQASGMERPGKDASAAEISRCMKGDFPEILAVVNPMYRQRETK